MPINNNTTITGQTGILRQLLNRHATNPQQDDIGIERCKIHPFIQTQINASGAPLALICV